MSDATYVLDASALLCLIFGEAGDGRVEEVMAGAKISAVNYSEVIAKLIDRGMASDGLLGELADLDLNVVSVDRRQAELAGLLRAQTRAAGLSLGDRACLALAVVSNGTAITADRAWAKVDVGVKIEVVR